MATIITSRRYEIKINDDGLISIPFDVCRSDGKAMEQQSFHLSTAVAGCSMGTAELESLGYDVLKPVVLPFIRVGIYDFFNIPVIASEVNVIGGNLLKWLNFSISNTENSFDADLIDRLKPLVEKGVNPNIKPAALSRVKSSKHNQHESWLTWEEIDARYPNSWVLVLDGDGDMADLGGEVVWHSETEIPDTSQGNTVLYCNKSLALKKPFLVQLDDYFRCRGFAKPGQAFSVFVEELEAKLAPPKINRFYFDVMSREGKLYSMRKSRGLAADNSIDSNAVLSQEEIDALFDEYGVK